MGWKLNNYLKRSSRFGYCGQPFHCVIISVCCLLAPWHNTPDVRHCQPQFVAINVASRPRGPASWPTSTMIVIASAPTLRALQSSKSTKLLTGIQSTTDANVWKRLPAIHLTRSGKWLSQVNVWHAKYLQLERAVGRDHMTVRAASTALVQLRQQRLVPGQPVRALAATKSVRWRWHSPCE